MDLETPRAMRPENYARRLDVSRALVYRWIGAGLPSIKLGRARRVLVAEADAWLLEHAAEEVR